MMSFFLQSDLCLMQYNGYFTEKEGAQYSSCKLYKMLQNAVGLH